MKLKTLLMESADVRATLRVEGVDKNKLRRFLLLFFNELKKKYPNDLEAFPANIVSPPQDPSMVFCNVQFKINNQRDLNGTKGLIQSVYEKWEKTFGSEIDSDLDFTRFQAP